MINCVVQVDSSKRSQGGDNLGLFGEQEDEGEDDIFSFSKPQSRLEN